MTAAQWVGYDPARVAALRARTIEATEALRSLSSSDAAAIGPLQAVRLAREHLELRWMPLLDAIVRSDALTAWNAPPPVARPAAGRPWRSPSAPAAGPLPHLSDEELITRYEDALDAVGAALLYHLDVEASWALLATVLAELGHRGAREPDLLASVFDGRDGPGLDRLVFAIDRAVTQPGLPRPTSAAMEAAADLLAVVARDEDLATRLGELAGEATVLARLLPLADFPRDAMVDIAGSALRRGRSDDGIDPVLARAAAVAAADEALVAIAADPDAALDLLSDPGSLLSLLTLGLDQDLVEHVVALGLGRAVELRPERVGDGLTVLAELVRRAGDDALTLGARRGVAAALGVYLPHVAYLEEWGDVRVSIGAQDPASATTTVLGSYDDATALLSQLVGDEQAQLVLGLVVRRRSGELVEAAARELPSDTTSTQANDHLAGALGPQAELLRMAVYAIADEGSARVAARAAMIARVTGPIRTAGTVAGFLPHPLARGVAKVSSPAAQLTASLLDLGEPAPVPDTGFVDLAMMDLDIDIIDVVVAEPRLAAAYGLGAAELDVLADYTARYRAAGDLATKADQHSRVRSFLVHLPDETLSSGLVVISAASGYEDVPDR